MNEDQTIKGAIETLEAEGRTHFCPTATVERGEAIGHALAFEIDRDACTDIAIMMLEQWNGHLSAAALRAIEKKQGTVERKGRTLTITLPEHWAKF